MYTAGESRDGDMEALTSQRFRIDFRLPVFFPNLTMTPVAS